MTVNDITNQARLDLVIWLLAVAGQEERCLSTLPWYNSKDILGAPHLRILKVKRHKMKPLRSKDTVFLSSLIGGGQTVALQIAFFLAGKKAIGVPRFFFQSMKKTKQVHQSKLKNYTIVST